jgi:hypothetical protein
MKTNASENRTLALAVMLSGIVAFIITSFTYPRVPQSAEATQAVPLSSAAGYPAPETELVPGRFYQFKGGVEDIHPDRTNHLVILVEYGGGWEPVESRPHRLFEVTQAPERTGLIYQIEKRGKEIVWIPVPPAPPETPRPVPQKRGANL